MDAKQRELARHALGLPNPGKCSYRNRFVAGEMHPDYPYWLAMVADGDAIVRGGASLPFGGDDLFHLTRAGGEKAIKPDEELCPEDFPSPALSGEE